MPYGDDTPNVQVGRRINVKGPVCVGSAIVLVIAANLAPTALVADQPAPLQCSAGTTFNAQTHKCVSSLKPPNVAPAATAPTSTKPFPITSIPHPAAVESPAKTKSQECSALATGFGGTVPTNSVAQWNALNCGPLPVLQMCSVEACSALASGCQSSSPLSGNFCALQGCNVASCPGFGFPGVHF